MATAKRNTRRKVKTTPLNSTKKRKTGKDVNLPFAQAHLRLVDVFDAEQAARKNRKGKAGVPEKLWTRLTFEDVIDNRDQVDRNDQDQETLHGSNSKPNRPLRRITVWMSGDIRGRGPNPNAEGDKGYLDDEVRARLAEVCKKGRGVEYLCDGFLTIIDSYGDQRQDTVVLHRLVEKEVPVTIGSIPW